MKAIKPVLCMFILSFSGAMFSVQAQSAATPMSKDQINAKYDMDKKSCDGMKGNAKDVCKKKAEADRDAAKANAKESKKDAEAHHDAQKDKMNSQYELAKEKCDAMSGDAKDKCVADAKTQYMK